MLMACELELDGLASKASPNHLAENEQIMLAIVIAHVPLRGLAGLPFHAFHTCHFLEHYLELLRTFFFCWIERGDQLDKGGLRLRGILETMLGFATARIRRPLGSIGSRCRLQPGLADIALLPLRVHSQRAHEHKLFELKWQQQDNNGATRTTAT